MGQVTVITLGCRLNAFESEAMRSLAQAAGAGETVIVNTCAVTAEAERQARQAIRRARREHPTARLIVTGCAAQIDPAAYAAIAGVDRVLGNAEKLQMESFGDGGADKVLVADIAGVRETAGHLVAGFEGRSRAFLQVQQGCDHRCTFCIIPYGRGPSRSVPPDEAIAQARVLVENGMRELVLTGVDLTAYGEDLPGRPTLGSLARRLLDEVPNLPRLRLSSLDPVEIDDDLWRLLGDEPRLMPHLHLSVQAGNDLILKRMRRRHARADAIAAAERARTLRPGIALGADLIAGFPTESEEMFADTLALVEECELNFLHVFPYSIRPGTPAARMPQVPAPVRRERAARLRALGQTVKTRFLETRLGTEAAVLVERDGGGHSEHFAPAVVAGGEAAPGDLVRGRVTDVAEGRLVVLQSAA